MKSCLRLVLMLIMVLSLMAGICISVGAEENTLVEEVSVSGTAIPELNVGDILPELSYSVAQEANYTVSAAWYKNDIQEQAGVAVEAGNVYRLQIDVSAKESYAFSADSFVLLINGEACDYILSDGSEDDGYVTGWTSKEYRFMTPIEKVELSYDVPEIGSALGEVKILEDANYTVSAQWYDYVAEEYIADDTVVTEGGAYAINIELNPVAGYEFTETAELWVNGEMVEFPSVGYDSIWYWSDNYNFGKPIDEVSVTYAEPVLGETLPVPTVTSDNCVLDYYYWYDYAVDEEATSETVAEKGHSYTLGVTVKAAAGYQFAEDVKITVNGVQPEEHNADDMYAYYYSGFYDFREEIAEITLSVAQLEVGKELPQVEVPSDAGYEVLATWCDMYTWEEVAGKVQDGGKYEVSICVEPKAAYKLAEEITFTYNGEVVDEREYSLTEYGLDYYKDYSFAEAVSKFQIGYETPQIGVEPSGITIPDDASYTLSEDSGWYNSSTGEKVEGAFESGERYELNVRLVLKFGYETAEKMEVYVNGAKINDYGNAQTEVYISEYHSFATPVAKVELPEWPQLKVGDSILYLAGDNKYYRYQLEWEGIDANGDYLELDTVRDGAVYYATIYAYPKEGYEFTDDTQVTLGGEALSGWSIRNNGVISDKTVYNFDAVEIVEKVELTADIPGYGEKGGEVKVLEDAGYKLEGFTWIVATEDDYSDAEETIDAYDHGDYALLAVQINAQRGYIFSSDVAITVNGEAYEPVIVERYQDYIYAFYDFGQIKKPSPTPATGDTTPVAMLSAMCLGALAGISVLLSKKRIAR